jgi:uncharacterized membrane protein YgdD (TMEM256/DUF423 family)
MFKKTYLIGALFGASAVVIGAFGAHALKTIFTAEQLVSFETGVKYQFYHAMVLLIISQSNAYLKSKLINLATLFFSLGTLLFSGSIYLLNILKAKNQIGLSGLGIITPIGGLLLVTGWILIFFGALNNKSNNNNNNYTID